MSSRKGQQVEESDSDSEDAIKPTHSLKILQVIGEGAYGTVYRAIWNGQIIAMKVIEHDERAQKEGNSIIHAGESFCPYDQEDGAPGDTIGVFQLLSHFHAARTWLWHCSKASIKHEASQFV